MSTKPLSRPKPKYLSVAVFEQWLSVPQAHEIRRSQLVRAKEGVDHMQSGDLGVELGFLNPEAGSFIKQRLDEMIEEGTTVPDILRSYKPELAKHGPTIRIRAVIGFSILGSALLTWLVTREWHRAVEVTAGLTYGWAAIEAVIPGFRGGRIRGHRLLHAIGFLVFPLALFLSIRQLVLLHGQFSGTPPTPAPFDVASFALFTGVAATSLAGVVAYGFLLLWWRHREIWFLETRIELTSGLIGTALSAAQAARFESARAQEIRLESAAELLKRTSIVLSMNPWDRQVAALLPFAAPRGVVSIWYLEPRPDVGDGTLQIRLFAAPGAPPTVIEAFEKIRRDHFPAGFDRKRYNSAIAACSDDEGNLNIEQFRTRLELEKFVSAAGFVLARGQAHDSGDARFCKVFNHSYVMGIKKTVGSADEVARWLDFRSFAAYPVFDTRNPSTPRGVLMAFKNLRNGVTGEDKHTLSATSRLLGFMFSDQPCVNCEGGQK